MSERCIVRVKFTPAGTDSIVRRAVGGFLRYVQHRDLHVTRPNRQSQSVAGLVKYVAYRDAAATRAELFGSCGLTGTAGRKAFVEFVGRSIADSQPQLFRTRYGRTLDKRRAVSRLIISPERSSGLDLERLTRAAMDGLAASSGVEELRWIAAIHRNTAHHHVHLVVAGMRLDSSGRYHRFDVSKARLAAIKQAVGEEIERQRRERLQAFDGSQRRPTIVGETPSHQASTRLAAPVLLAVKLRIRAPGPKVQTPGAFKRPTFGSVFRLRAVARAYQRRLEHELEDEARRRQWELAA